MRLFEIEWLKLKNYKVFWSLLGLYLLGLALVGCSGMILMDFLKSHGAEFKGIGPTMVPLYDFPDVWQNLAYVAGFFKIFPAFIVIISVGNEYTFRTLRQNIIDGMGKMDWIISKFALISGLSLMSMLWLTIMGLAMGLVYAHDRSLSLIFSQYYFVLAHGLQLFVFMCLALLLTFLMKRSGFVIVVLFMYSMIFEPIATVNFEHNPYLPTIFAKIAPFMPVNAINNLVHVPFQRYIFLEIQDYVSFNEAAIVLVWMLILVWAGFKLLSKRDL